MKIYRVDLENFRTLKGNISVSLDTNESLNLVTAEQNGAGKTSIFLSIAYMLTGFVYGKTQEDYINWDSDFLTCSMDFEYNGHNYTISNELHRGKTLDKTLIIDNNETITGSRSVDKKLKEIIDFNLFLNSTCLFQGVKNFTSIKDSERRDNLKNVFNIDYSSDIKDLDKEEKKLQAEVIDVKTKELYQLQGAKFEEKDLRFYEEVNDDNVEDYKKEISELEEQKTLLQAKLSNIDTIQANVARLKHIINSRSSYCQENNIKIEDSSKELEKLENYKRNETYLDSLNEELSSIKLLRIASFDDSELDNVTKSIAECETEIRNQKIKLNDCLKGICPECGAKLTNADTDSTRNKIEELEKNKEALFAKKKELQDKKKKYQDNKNKNDSNKYRKDLLNQKIESEQNRLNQEDINSKKDIENIKAKIESYNADNNRYQKEADDANKELSKIEIIDSSSIKKDILNITTSISNKKESVDKFNNIKLYNEETEKQNEKVRQDKIANDIKIKEVQDLIDNSTIKKQQLEKMKSFLKKEFPSYVIGAMIEQIQNSMNDFINRVYYKDLNVRIEATDDNISVTYGTGKHKIDTSNASGAEEALLSLSYCYALNQLKHYDILLIDEIDAPFTEDNSRKLAEIIVSMRNLYDFIFVVSHVKATKDFYYTEKANIINL